MKIKEKIWKWLYDISGYIFTAGCILTVLSTGIFLIISVPLVLFHYLKELLKCLL